MKDIAVDKPFVDLPPSPLNAVRIFSGEWASKFPSDFPKFPESGAYGLFEDERIEWADQALRTIGSGFRGADVLELGPLEGGHTYMMARLGANEVLAIEANARAYLKCLVVKEVLELGNARFLLGNALPYLRSKSRTFDVGVACAFLNHLVQPVEVIELLAAQCRAVYLWNVVFHPSVFEKQPELETRFAPPIRSEWSGFQHTLHPHFYGEGIDYRKFWGGTDPSCCWMEAEDMVAALKHFGFTRWVAREEDNPFGKALGVVATRDSK